jgi:hypothetical protein
MTIILSQPYATFAIGETVDLDNATEAALVAQGRARYTANPGPAFEPLTAAEQQTVRDQLPAVKFLVTGAGVPKDLWLNFIVSGFVLPATGANATASITAGVAYINGIRVDIPGRLLGLTASRDNYVDLSDTGAVTVTPVTLAAAAPAVAVNSMRLGFVKTGVSTITSATQTGKDSLGNWMSNILDRPACILSVGSGQFYATSTPAPVVFGAGTEVFDNDFMHSVSVNNVRITINRPGIYAVQGSITTPGGVSGVVGAEIFRNGALLAAQISGVGNNATNATFAAHASVLCAAGDYLQLNFNPVNNGLTLAAAYFEARRV